MLKLLHKILGVLEMKKILFGMITILSLVMFSACTNEKKSMANSTIDSLKKRMLH